MAHSVPNKADGRDGETFGLHEDFRRLELQEIVNVELRHEDLLLQVHVLKSVNNWLGIVFNITSHFWIESHDLVRTQSFKVIVIEEQILRVNFTLKMAAFTLLLISVITPEYRNWLQTRQTSSQCN